MGERWERRRGSSLLLLLLLISSRGDIVSDALSCGGGGLGGLSLMVRRHSSGASHSTVMHSVASPQHCKGPPHYSHCIRKHPSSYLHSLFDCPTLVIPSPLPPSSCFSAFASNNPSPPCHKHLGSVLPLDPIAPATAGTAATLTPLPSSIVTSAPVSVSAPAAEVALDSVDRLNASRLSTHNASDAPIAAPALPVDPVAPVLAAAVLSAPKPKLKTSSTTRTPVSLSPTTSSQTPARSLNPAPTPAHTPVAPETRLTRSQTQPVHRFFQQLLSRTSTQRQHFQRHYLSNASMCCCQEFPVYSSKLLLSSSEMRLPPELDHLCLLCVFALCSCLGPQMQSMLLHWRPDIASEIETYYAQFYTNDESLAIASSITPQQREQIDVASQRCAQHLTAKLRALFGEAVEVEDEKIREEEEEEVVKRGKKEEKRRKKKEGDQEEVKEEEKAERKVAAGRAV